MSDFDEICKSYVDNLSLYSHGKHSFDCKYGTLTFIKNNNNSITIFEIYIIPEYRNKGLCKKFLINLIEYLKINKIRKLHIISVLSKILYDFLNRWIYGGKRWKLKHDGFCYSI